MMIILCGSYYYGHHACNGEGNWKWVNADEVDQLRAELARRDEVIADLKEENDELHGCISTDILEIARLQEKLHDEMSQLEIATDLGNKRWLALNDIYENGEKHNTNWCKRKAQEGLGIK